MILAKAGRVSINNFDPGDWQDMLLLSSIIVGLYLLFLGVSLAPGGF